MKTKDSALKLHENHRGTYRPVLGAFKPKLLSSLTNLSASTTFLADSIDMAEPAKGQALLPFKFPAFQFQNIPVHYRDKS